MEVLLAEPRLCRHCSEREAPAPHPLAVRGSEVTGGGTYLPDRSLAIHGQASILRTRFHQALPRDHEPLDELREAGCSMRGHLERGANDRLAALHRRISRLVSRRADSETQQKRLNVTGKSLGDGLQRHDPLADVSVAVPQSREETCDLVAFELEHELRNPLRGTRRAFPGRPFGPAVAQLPPKAVLTQPSLERRWSVIGAGACH